MTENNIAKATTLRKDYQQIEVLTQDWVNN
jgi:hypothetical protein